jgi:hypothetical protein
MNIKKAVILLGLVIIILSGFLLSRLVERPIARIGFTEIDDNKIVIYAYGYDEHGKTQGLKELALFEDDKLIRLQKFQKQGMKHAHFSIERQLDDSQPHAFYAKVVDLNGNKARSETILVTPRSN